MALSRPPDSDDGDLGAVHCWGAGDWRSREEYGRRVWDWRAVMVVGRRLSRGGIVAVCLCIPFLYILLSSFLVHGEVSLLDGGGVSCGWWWLIFSEKKSINI